MLKIIGATLFGLLVLTGAAQAQQCGPLPYPNIINGTIADASQVMGDFNTLLNCAAPAANPHFSGTIDLGPANGVRQLVYGASGTNGYQMGFGINLGQATNSLSIFVGGASGVCCGAANFAVESANQSTWPYTSYTTRFVVNSQSGNVGIGTVSPGSKLSISTAAQSTDGIVISGSDGHNVGLHASMGAGSWNGITQAGDSGIMYSGGSPGTGGFVLTPWASATSGVRLDNNGNVGIGISSPSYLLHVNGTAYAVGAAGALSDIRHKKYVAPLKDGALDNVMKLRPVSFEWKAPKDDGMRGQQMGFIAQEVERVLPTAVLTQSDPDKTKGLKYNEIIAVLTKALQEQEGEIKVLRENHDAEVKGLELRHETEIQNLRSEQRAEIERLKADQQAQIDSLKEAFAALKSSKVASAQ